MPSGQIHYEYFKKGYRIIIPVSLLICIWDWQLGTGNLAGYSFHRYCDNDWDLTTATSSDGRTMRELPIIGHFLFGVSSTYSSVFRRTHRKPISHAPFLSTAIRLFFVFIIPFIVGDSLGINFIGGGWINFWIGFYVGLSQADAIHYYLDLHYGD